MNHKLSSQVALLLVTSVAVAGAFPALACSKAADVPAHGGTAAGGSSSTGSTGRGTSSSGDAGGSGGTGPAGTGFGGVFGSGGSGGAGGAGGGGGAGGSGGSGGAGGFGGSGGGGSGGAAPASSSASSSGAGTSSSSGGSTACAIGNVVISEIRSRGAGGASDEFVTLFNATGSAVTLDATWVLQGRGTSDVAYDAHWTGAGAIVPAWGHFLIAGSAYVETPAPDDALTRGIVDAAGLRLVHAGVTVSAVCYAYNAATMASFDATFTCPGTPVSNLPHNNTSSAASNTDASIARLPGGAAGNCTDTGDNASDFVAESPATPESSASPPTP